MNIQLSEQAIAVSPSVQEVSPLGQEQVIAVTDTDKQIALTVIPAKLVAPTIVEKIIALTVDNRTVSITVINDAFATEKFLNKDGSNGPMTGDLYYDHVGQALPHKKDAGTLMELIKYTKSYKYCPPVAVVPDALPGSFVEPAP